ncbi:MAG TPA: GNAT family N-acetyltransferase [Pyrinomonadaceae bacterium]|nr:GNAT family N-acetyltransferase [Pyrinomonadaceae bacterium]
MVIEVREESATALAEYARIPIAFEVKEIFEVAAREGGLGGFVLTERRLDTPYIKDYDAFAEESPAHWAERFDVSNWEFLAAHYEGGRVGGAAVALDTAGLGMLEGRRDLAVLWDIRVAPEARGRGVGAALFRAAEARAAARGCLQLKVETQNINVPACRFYARQGCELGAIKRFAYPELPHEIQLLWYKQLMPDDAAADLKS